MGWIRMGSRSPRGGDQPLSGKPPAEGTFTRIEPPLRGKPAVIFTDHKGLMIDAAAAREMSRQNGAVLDAEQRMVDMFSVVSHCIQDAAGRGETSAELSHSVMNDHLFMLVKDEVARMGYVVTPAAPCPGCFPSMIISWG